MCPYIVSVRLAPVEVWGAPQLRASVRHHTHSTFPLLYCTHTHTHTHTHLQHAQKRLEHHRHGDALAEAAAVRLQQAKQVAGLGVLLHEHDVVALAERGVQRDDVLVPQARVQAHLFWVVVVVVMMMMSIVGGLLCLCVCCVFGGGGVEITQKGRLAAADHAPLCALCAANTHPPNTPSERILHTTHTSR